MLLRYRPVPLANLLRFLPLPAERMGADGLRWRLVLRSHYILFCLAPQLRVTSQRRLRPQ